MKRSITQLLLGGGIVLGAAACGVLIWWSAAPLPHDAATGDGASDRLPVPVDSGAGWTEAAEDEPR